MTKHFLPGSEPDSKRRWERAPAIQTKTSLERTPPRVPKTMLG